MIYFNHNRENCEEVRVNHKYINKERYKNMTIQIEKLTNAITVSGILLSADVRSMELEMEDKETGNKVKRPVVSGRLEIITKIDEETGSKSTETVEIFANKYTKNGTLNSAVETLEEILGGIKTNEEIKALKKKDPNYKNKVVIYDKSDNEPKKYYCSVWNSNKQYAPKFNVNRYVSQNEIKKSVRISGGNLTIKPFEEDRHKLYCDFELDCIVRNIQEELDKDGNPTGRAILTVFAPVMNQKELDGVELKMYAGILPALEEGQEEVDLGSAFLDEVQEQDCMKIFGTMENSVRVIENKIECKFGRPRVEKRTEYKNEYIITGADFLDEDTFEVEDIRDLLKSISMKEQEMLEQSEEQSDEPIRSTARGLGAKPNSSKRRNGFF